MNTRRGNYVMLRAGALRLLLPQSDVGAAEYLDAQPRPTDVPGLLRSGTPGDERTYAALSDAMSLLPQCPPERFIACELAGSADPLVWCWDEVRVLIGLDLESIRLPRWLLTKHPPVMEYVEFEGAPVFVCTADEVGEFALQVLETADET